MKYVSFEDQRGVRIGAQLEARDGRTEIADLSALCPDLPRSMRGFLEAGPQAWEAAAKVLAGALDSSFEKACLPLSEMQLRCPIADPGKILAIGLNYSEHIAETGREKPQHQMWFNKQWNATCGPGDEILLPAVAPDLVDYEAELCLIIGRRCRHVPAQRAREVIFGVTCGNDVSVRDWQKRTPQFTLGKSFATHAPLGPCIVTLEAFGDLQNKGIRCLVNGEERQASNTRHMIFTCDQLIAELSSVFELCPGDVIFTGTPAGVGMAHKPPAMLRAGDEVVVEVEGIGSLTNRVALEEKHCQIS